MKINDVFKLRLQRQTMDEIDVDVGEVIASDEFNRRTGGSYVKNTIKRLIGMKVSFRSNCNISSEMTSQFIQVKCPCCGKKMEWLGSSGNSAVQSVEYSCGRCKATVVVSIPHTGISVCPGEKNERKD